MNSTQDIGWYELIIGSCLVVLPLLIFWYYKAKLMKDTIIAVIRMIIQLLFVGFYLEYLFILNSALINLLWVLIMIIVATFSITSSAKLKLKYFAFPNFVAILLSLALVDAFFLGYIIKLPNVFEAQYLIPITGMILGNSLQNNIISLNSFYNDIRKNEIQYRYSLSLGATLKEATLPFMQEAIRKSFSPTIARMAVLGLISLPGTMTGQIIGGSSPVVAIKYQILIMVMIFVSSVISVALAIIIANNYAFDKYFNLKYVIFKDKAKK